MERQEKEKLSLYGKLVWDFANAKTTDQILISFFENLQATFNLSKDFKEKALIQYPTKKMAIDTLSSKEYDLFEILLNRNEILESCSGALRSGYYSLEKYDPIDSIFTISEGCWVGGDADNSPEFEEETFLIPVEEVDEYIDNIAIQEDWKDNLKTELKTLANLYHQIEDMKSQATNRFPDIEKMAKAYPYISEIHDYVKETQDNLKRIILQIIETDNAYESKGFKRILSRYNTIHKTKYLINDDHNLIEIGPFTEDYFFDGVSRLHKDRIFNAPISYCLIEFLKNPEYSGKERIAECKHCNCIFGKSKLYDRQHYCPICSKRNHTPKEEQAKRTRISRAAKKKEKRKSLFDAQYRRLIQSGHSEKQARKGAEEYVIEQMPVIE